MADSLWTPIVFSILMTEFTYYLLVISVHVFSSIIMIIFLLATLVRTKHWNSFTINIPSLVSMLMYNNSTSFISFVCDLNHNVTSLIDFSSNFLFPNGHEIPFL